MKKVKIIFWVIVIVFVGIVIFQNQDFFLDKQSLKINLWLVADYQTPETPNAVFFIACLLLGLIIAYISGLFERFKFKRTIKMLNKSIDSQMQTISELNNKIESFQNVSVDQNQTNQDNLDKYQNVSENSD